MSSSRPTVRFTLTLGGVTALLAALTSCSYFYDVNFDITLSAEVAALSGAVVLEVEGDEGADHETLAHTPGTTSYQGTVGVCCSPKPTVDVRAFFDEDGNGAYDEGEAIAEYEHNPVTLDSELNVELTLELP